MASAAEDRVKISMEKTRESWLKAIDGCGCPTCVSIWVELEVMERAKRVADNSGADNHE